jgi:hypothetical protein
MGAKRIMTVAALAIGLGALGTSPAFADDGQSEPRKAKAEDTSKRVCRTVVPSGSRLGTRICKTQAQWDDSRDKTQDNLLQFQMNEQTTMNPAPGA